MEIYQRLRGGHLLQVISEWLPICHYVIFVPSPIQDAQLPTTHPHLPGADVQPHDWDLARKYIMDNIVYICTYMGKTSERLGE
jgi:hypothetical protein